MTKRTRRKTKPNELKKVEGSFSAMTFKASGEANEKQQTESPLMLLPAEVRNDIYKQVALSEPAMLWLNGHRIHTTTTKPPAGIAFLMTCKQARREAYNIVWDDLWLDLTVLDESLPEYSNKQCGEIRDSPSLRKIKNIHIHFEPAAPSNYRQCNVEARDRALTSIMLDNDNLKHLRLVTYSPLYATLGYCKPAQNNMIKLSYHNRFGDMIHALRKRQVYIELYNPTSKQMEEKYSTPRYELVPPKTWEQMELEGNMRARDRYRYGMQERPDSHQM